MLSSALKIPLASVSAMVSHSFASLPPAEGVGWGCCRVLMMSATRLTGCLSWRCRRRVTRQEDKARAILIKPAWKREWWSEVVKIIEVEWLLPEKKIFLRNGQTRMATPRWRVWAFLVDGGLAEAGEDQVPIMGRHTKNFMLINEVEACVRCYATLGSGGPDAIKVESSNATREVASVVTTMTVPRGQKITEWVASVRSGIVEKFKCDVLSGTLHKDPPVRGPYGEASINLKAGAKPKRMRGFQVHGPKAEALEKMVEDFTEIGWLEPSYSEWGSAAFVVPKKEEGQWRMVVDCRRCTTPTPSR